VLWHVCYNVQDIQFYYTAVYRNNKPKPGYLIQILIHRTQRHFLLLCKVFLFIVIAVIISVD